MELTPVEEAAWDAEETQNISLCPGMEISFQMDPMTKLGYIHFGDADTRPIHEHPLDLGKAQLLILWIAHMQNLSVRRAREEQSVVIYRFE